VKFLEDNLDLRDQDGRNYSVLAPFDYAVGAANGSTIVHVPVGFQTDFASIPRVFWPFIPPNGWYGKAAVLHDFLYRYGKIGDMVIDRKYADDVLNEAMCVLRAAWVLEHGATKSGYPQCPRGEFRSLLERQIIYWGVRLGGWATWNGYRSKESAAAH